MAAAISMVVGMVLLGGVSLTEAAIDLHAVAHLLADAAASESADTGRLTVYATQAETGEPLEGVTFLFQGNIDGEEIRQESQTDGKESQPCRGNPEPGSSPPRQPGQETVLSPSTTIGERDGTRVSVSPSVCISSSSGAGRLAGS